MAAWQTKAGKNPQGGLNAAGRASLQSQGQNIRPGVKNYSSASPADKQRWISWARRFYTNPSGPMKDAKGRPTRLALTARAWGEAVPSNHSQAQAIARKAKVRQARLRSVKRV